MEKHFKRTLITTALPYANGPVHIGHLAGVYVPADIYARYLRLKGEEVLMIGGSDEHGVPITLRAKKEGITPQDVVDRYHGIIKKSFEEFGITFDIYSRTTSLRIIRWPRIFSVHCMIKVNSSRKQASNTTMRRRSNSWPTVISRVLVRVVETRRRMAISARLAVRLLARRI